MTRHPYPAQQAAETAYLRARPIPYELGRNLSGAVPALSPAAAAWIEAHRDPSWTAPKLPKAAPLKPKRLTDAQRVRIDMMMEAAGWTVPASSRTSAT